MVNKFKKLGMAMMVTTMALVGIVSATESASAATHRDTEHFMYDSQSGIGETDGWLISSDDYYNVYATVDVSTVGTWGVCGTAELSLQRYDGRYWWQIATDSGSFCSDSSFHGKFENISTAYNDPTRVVAQIYGYNGVHTNSVFGDSWIR